MDLKLLSCRLSALSVFRGILDKKEMTAFLSFLRAEDVCDKLNEAGFMSTKLSTTGSFLKAGNVTFLIGVEADMVEACLDVMRDCCSKRTQMVSTGAGSHMDQFFTSLPVEITVGYRLSLALHAAVTAEIACLS